MSSNTQCYEDICPDRKKYDTLIYSITCDVCLDKKLKYIASIDAETFEEKLERAYQKSVTSSLNDA